MPLRLVFMGTPDFAVPTLAEIVGRGHDVVAVYTRAPKPAGRGMELQRSPVEVKARQFGLPVLTPASLKGEDVQAEFRAHGADAAVVVAYGLILPKAILDAPPLGCFNLHASALPRWRGAAPINRAIMAGVKIAMGTDAGTPYNLHGENLGELPLMVEAGMSPMQAIVASTQMGARLLQLDHLVGVLAEGKLADLVIVKGDPLGNIALFNDPANVIHVMKDGVVARSSLPPTMHDSHTRRPL